MDQFARASQVARFLVKDWQEGVIHTTFAELVEEYQRMRLPATDPPGVMFRRRSRAWRADDSLSCSIRTYGPGAEGSLVRELYAQLYHPANTLVELPARVWSMAYFH